MEGWHTRSGVVLARDVPPLLVCML